MKSQLIAIGSFSIALAVGCSGGDQWTENLPETVEVSGVVTLDGQPLEGAAVIFAPDDGKYAGQALTDSSGRFEAQAFPSKEGMVPGSYKVGVSKTIERKGKAVTGPDAAHDAGGGVEWVNVVPVQYTDPTKSGLTAQIPEGGTTELKFDVKSK